MSCLCGDPACPSCGPAQGFPQPYVEESEDDPVELGVGHHAALISQLKPEPMVSGPDVVIEIGGKLYVSLEDYETVCFQRDMLSLLREPK